MIFRWLRCHGLGRSFRPFSPCRLGVPGDENTVFCFFFPFTPEGTTHRPKGPRPRTWSSSLSSFLKAGPRP